MKRLDLIQLIIIIVTLLVAFRAVELFPQFILLVISWTFGGMAGGGVLDELIYIGLYLAVYTICVLLLISRSKGLAFYISQKFDLDHQIRLDQSKNNLLYILFIGVGIYSLIQKLPVLLNSIWNAFSDQVSNRGLFDDRTDKPDFLLLGLQILLPLLLIIFARDLASYFSNKIENKDEIEEFVSEKQE